MTLSESICRLAEAIKAAAAEHGRPNSFSCGELEAHYGGPKARTAGLIAKGNRYRLWMALGGRDGWGSCPTYGGGRFYV